MSNLSHIGIRVDYTKKDSTNKYYGTRCLGGNIVDNNI